MPSKPELDAYEDDDCLSYAVTFMCPHQCRAYQAWLSEHGWKAFQDFYELQEVKNEPSASTS